MYGIFSNIYPINGPNVGKYTIHGAYGYPLDHGDYMGLSSTSTTRESRFYPTVASACTMGFQEL
jgi:hypothetical protein